MRCFFVQTGSAEPSKYTHYLYDSSGQRVKKITRKQGGSYTATTYIDGAFEYTKGSAGFDSIPNLQIGSWVIGNYSTGSGEQNLLHIMGGATRRIGDALGDTTPAIKYSLTDHLGSSTILLDTNGTTVSLEEYYPFGETSFGSYAKKRYRFCGKEKDEESGLYYYGMRYYSAWTCRFISVDPLAGKYPFYTPYQYTGNNPITFTDLDGQETTPNATTGVPTNGQQGGSGSSAPPTTGGTYNSNGENNNGVHTVVGGNTLWNLSERYGVSVEDIQKANNIDASNTIIKVGQQLTIPGQTTSNVSALPPNTSSNIQKGLVNPWVLPGTLPTKIPTPVEEPIPLPNTPWWVYPAATAVLTIAFILKPTTAEAPTNSTYPYPKLKQDTDTPPSPPTTPEDDDDSKYVYRAMEMDADGKPNVPAIDSKEVYAKHLGVREADLKGGLRNGDGTVSPGHNKGGMSTSLTPTFNSDIQSKIDSGKMVVFKNRISDLVKNGLIIDPDGGDHASVQPAMTMSEKQYQRNIRMTRNLWMMHR